MTKKKKRNVLTGEMIKHRRGFGFVRCENMDRDIFISADSMGGAMNGDTVEVDLIPEYLWKNSPEGIVTRVVGRKTTEIVGTFDRSRKFGFVVPESRKFPRRCVRKKEGFFWSKEGRQGRRADNEIP